MISGGGQYGKVLRKLVDGGDGEEYNDTIRSGRLQAHLERGLYGKSDIGERYTGVNDVGKKGKRTPKVEEILGRFDGGSRPGKCVFWRRFLRPASG